jgi:hypothetical protein
MKIRIIQEGSKLFTGDFGPVPFIDGVSTRDVSPLEATMLAGLIAVETMEDTPRNPSMSQQIIDSHCVSMDEGMDLNSLHIIQPPKKLYTRGELEAIADKDGIEGLRGIGVDLGVKGNSIVKLIGFILHAQERHQAPVAAAFIEAPEPVAETPKVEMLIGTSLLGATTYIGGHQVQLGAIVRKAFEVSGLTNEAWNSLPEPERDQKIVAALAEMKATGGRTTSAGKSIHGESDVKMS